MLPHNMFLDELINFTFKKICFGPYAAPYATVFSTQQFSRAYKVASTQPMAKRIKFT